MTDSSLRTKSSSSQLFLLLSLFLACYLLALLITTAISLSGIPIEKILNANELSEILKFNLNDKDFIFKLKWAQLFASIMIFIVPPVIFVRLALRQEMYSAADQKPGNMMNYFRLDKPFPFLFALLIPLLMMASLPLINLMAELNAKMSFPGFLHDVEQWMRKAEEDAKITTEAFLKMDSFGSMMFNVLVIAVIPAFGEELLFRGVVQKLLVRWTRNIHWGIWTAAVLFSALHWQFYGFLPRMALGALLGYLLVWSGSLWLPILAHFVNNGAAVVVAWLIQRGTVSAEIENLGSGRDEIYYVASSALLVTGIIWMIWQRRVRDEDTGLTGPG